MRPARYYEPDVGERVTLTGQVELADLIAKLEAMGETPDSIAWLIAHPEQLPDQENDK